MKRLIIIALLLVPGMVWAEGFPGRGAPNYSARCFPLNSSISDGTFDDEQVLNTQAEGCFESDIIIKVAGVTSLSNAIVWPDSVGSATVLLGNTSFTRSLGIPHLFRIKHLKGADTTYETITFGISSEAQLSFRIGNVALYEENWRRPNFAYYTASDPATEHNIATIVGGYSSGAIPYYLGQNKSDFGVGYSYFIKGGLYTTWTLVYKSISLNTSAMTMSSISASSAGQLWDIIIPRIDLSHILQPVHLSLFATDGELSAYTPTVGPTWTEDSGDWDTASGVLVNTALGIATFDSGVSTAIYDANIKTPASGTTNGGMIARYVDNTHFWYVALDDTNDKVYLYECDDDACVAGDEGDKRIDDAVTGGLAANTAYNVRLAVSATSPYWSIFINGLLEGTYTTAGTSSTATKFGLRDEGNANIVAFDNVALWKRTSNEYDAAFSRVAY